MVDFEKMVGKDALRDRIARHVDGIVDLDREAETIKAQRKEAIAAAETEDRLNGPAISAVARLIRTGSTSATAEVWPFVEMYCERLGIVLPSSPQLDLFGGE